MKPARPVRDVNVPVAAAEFDRRRDGTCYVRSPRPLGPYPVRITETLEYWAEHAPERTFLARRGTKGDWVRLTYREAFDRGRHIAQGLLDRRLSAERPLAILSGNSLDHALVALGALCAGIPYAPLAPAYSLATHEYTTLRYLWNTLRPGLAFAEGAEY